MSPPNEKRRPLRQGERRPSQSLGGGSTTRTVPRVGAYPLDGVDDLERFMSLAAYASSVGELSDLILSRVLTERSLMQLATFCMRLAGAAATLPRLAEPDVELKEWWLGMRGEPVEVNAA